MPTLGSNVLNVLLHCKDTCRRCRCETCEFLLACTRGYQLFRQL